jgi:hypothetical protein
MGRTHVEGVPMTSFASDIAPLFRQRDVQAMSWMFDLSAYDDVRENADAILEVVEDGSMPCDEPWSHEQVAVFRTWTDEDCPP